MATAPPSSVIPPPSQPPSGVQPGGGLIVQLELLWGRLRRWWLRTFRPGYVRRMLACRQGECPDCPHDIIDSRDLKFVRNVCGYWFRPEDDRYAWLDRLPFATWGHAELLLSVGLLLPLFVGTLLATLWHHWLWAIPALAAFLFLVEVVWFFRDPQRVLPDDPLALLSPADGTITHIDEVEEADFPGGRAFRISIFLSIFNVHVNRVPRNGSVRQLRYFRGRFLDARRPDCGVLNEQLWVDLEEPSGRPVRIKQIVGALARRIVCQLRVGEQVTAGQRFGMIKFGSRTDILIPAGEPLDLNIKLGDKVQGGSTVLLRFRG